MARVFIFFVGGYPNLWVNSSRAVHAERNIILQAQFAINCRMVGGWEGGRGRQREREREEKENIYCTTQ
jgi:hypothetical protein